MLQILDPVNLQEPWYLVVLAGRRSKSQWRVLYERKTREWQNLLSKYAGAGQLQLYLHCLDELLLHIQNI